MEYVLHEIQFNTDSYKKAVQLRQDVLRSPLGLRFQTRELAEEKDQIHIGLFQNHQLIGCLSLVRISVTELKMRQVAVDPSYQGQGVGRKLVEFAEQKARNMGFTNMTLHAREAAVPFYLKLNYSVVGEPFTEVTLPHRKMIKLLI